MAAKKNRRFLVLILAIAILFMLSFQVQLLWFDQFYFESGSQFIEDSVVVPRKMTGSIIPYELSVNHLRLIKQAPGAPPLSSSSQFVVTEDFLPVVTPKDLVFRWRHRAQIGSESISTENILYYRILVRLPNKENDDFLWDSGKLPGSPDSVHWKDDILLSSPGFIVEWCVEVWDSKNRPHTSDWSKFAIGPEQQTIQNENNSKGNNGQDGLLAKWIVHPSDMDTFDKNKLDKKLLEEDKWDFKKRCDRWNLRRYLPIFRARVSVKPIISDDNSNNIFTDDAITSALLLVSGLGSVRVSFDGINLSTSGPIDPAFTDYAQRVSYRGYDVTSFLRNKIPKNKRNGGTESIRRDDAFHVIGITTGSGWYDSRPLGKDGVGIDYKLLPTGPITIIAQLYVTYASGKTNVVAPTGVDASEWQVSRGHIVESDLFTGETIDLNVLQSMDGWDTPRNWNHFNATSKLNDDLNWVNPVLYRTDVTFDAWRQFLEQEKEPSSSSDTARNNDSSDSVDPQNFASPIGKLIPSEIPPILPMERLAPDEIFDLGSGRWLFDFGKAISGMLRFENGLPVPLIPKVYPRGHSSTASSARGDSFITIIYGESLELTTGDINRVLTAGFGHHDGGPTHLYNETYKIACFPDDQDGTLSQRDTFVASSPMNEVDREILFKNARQSHFTTHAFRFAEICCLFKPPEAVHALMYRTAFNEWGYFDSSNILINGGYELVKNALNSNFLSIQSDCPHREKLPYGGDLIASSPTALHMFDMSSFYKKSIRDWMDGQWENGAYAETSFWQDLNDPMGFGHGSGETVWASAPPILTVRHMHHYGDISFLKESLPNHVRWLDFLDENFDTGMKKLGYDEELIGYYGDGKGLSDWLSLRDRDTFLTHIGFYMASARSVAYIAEKLGMTSLKERGLVTAKKLQDRINKLYFKNGKDNFDYPEGHGSSSPGPDMGLFTRIVPGEKRCKVLRNVFTRKGQGWNGHEERDFLSEVTTDSKKELIDAGELIYDHSEEDYTMHWSQWQGFNEGIFGVRYIIKMLSESGFHNVALGKATGTGFGTIEYLLRHNATSMWETWWRSESLYSRNHPMLGAFAEWIPSSVAGLGLHPKTSGGRKFLFWPQFPHSAATLEYASAVQGSPRGDFALAWEFMDLPIEKEKYNSAVVSIRIRLMIPPGGEGTLRLPLKLQKKASVTIRRALSFPDIERAQLSANEECETRRKQRMGFPFSWEYNKDKKRWYKLESSKAIGTPCMCFLFHPLLDDTRFENELFSFSIADSKDRQLKSGFYEVIIDRWQLEREPESDSRKGNFSHYYDTMECKSDPDSFEWDINDAYHMI